MLLSPREVDVFEAARGRLLAIAYRMLGSAGDAEDAVQDTFLRWQAADREHVEIPQAWLTRALTNVCLNQLTSARARRETYVGQWLPEPVLAGDRALGPAETVEQRESVSLAVLTLLERLAPRERAVYVLHEAFGYPHAEIAAILDVSEANCQQMLHRARRHLGTDRVREAVDPGAAAKIVEEFLAAALSGETEPLVRLLTDDAVSVADGGGQVPARSTPIVGALRIARFLRGLFRPTEARRGLVETVVGAGVELHVADVNGTAAVLVTSGDRVVGVLAPDVTPAGVAALNIQVAPAKLERISRQWAATEHGAPFATPW
jgi:RNA polymerase sigma-70 factor (TIGR02957 family)